MSAFTKKNKFSVNQKKYRSCRQYDYRKHPSGDPKYMPPVVHLNLQNVENYVSRKIWMLVDTGGSITILSKSSAEALRVDRRLRKGERLTSLIGIGGQRVLGVLRWIRICLGGRQQKVLALVPALMVTTKGTSEPPLGLSPQHDILGRSKIFENYLLCFGQRRLYAFCRRR